MATPFDPKQIVSFEELLTSQVVQQEALPLQNLSKITIDSLLVI